MPALWFTVRVLSFDVLSLREQLVTYNMDKACWKPSKAARKTGILSFSPKKGALLRSFFMKGRFGLNRNA